MLGGVRFWYRSLRSGGHSLEFVYLQCCQFRLGDGRGVHPKPKPVSARTHERDQILATMSRDDSQQV
jgi:hypothetical protein